jgi:hypothetical protein
MKIKLALFAFSAITVVACHTSKKTTTSTAAANSATTPTVVITSTTASSSPGVAASSFIPSIKTSDGVYDPGTEELTAIQSQYKDATMEQLKEGYTLYAKSACISCHSTVNIYRFREDRWAFIIQDMAYRAKLTPTQKDAVLKYVYAIKATDPNKK